MIMHWATNITDANGNLFELWETTTTIIFSTNFSLHKCKYVNTQCLYCVGLTCFDSQRDLEYYYITIYSS